MSIVARAQSYVVVLFLTSACAGLERPAPEHATQDATRPRGQQLIEIADLFAQQGDRVRAAQYLSWAERDGVPASEVIPRLLALYAVDGQYRVAIDAAEAYLRRHPRDQRIRKCLGALYLAIEASDDARRTFEMLVRDTPEDPEAHYALASVLKTVGTQHARADEQYRAYLALAPNGEHAEEVRAGLLKELP